MATIAGVFKNVKKLDLYSAGTAVVRKNNEPILNLNKKQLFGKGENKIGKKLKPYSIKGSFLHNGSFVNYAEYKHERNQSPGLGNPDLFNTGDFFKGWKLKIINKNEFEMFGTEQKTKSLTKKYGADIFGLADYSRNEMIKKFFQKDLMIEIKKVTKL
jgi:hypothetical protein